MHSNVIIFIHYTYKVSPTYKRFIWGYVHWCCACGISRFFFQFIFFLNNWTRTFKIQKAVVSPKSLFHLVYMLRVAGLTLGLMRFRESSKSFILMLRICECTCTESITVQINTFKINFCGTVSNLTASHLINSHTAHLVWPQLCERDFILALSRSKPIIN